MKRRRIIAGATAVGMSVTGGLTWFMTREGDGNDDGDEKGAQSDPEREENKAPDDTNNDEQLPQDSEEEDEGEESTEEQPEAANPEPEPEVDTDESAIDREAEDAEPTAEDVTLSDTELVTESNAATVTGTATNEADVPLTIDLEVTFLEDGTELTTALGGTTGLEPGDSWEFTISARGSEYSDATDYEIAPTVQTSG